MFIKVHPVAVWSCVVLLMGLFLKTQMPGCPKVRSLWSDIDWMLSTIKDEKNAMESVLLGDVDQYILDGTDRVLKVPRCLLERIERLPHQVRLVLWNSFLFPFSSCKCKQNVWCFTLIKWWKCLLQLSSGNMYETGQLNLLCVLELVTHALQILTDERRGVSIPTRSELSSQHLQEKCQQMACVLQDLYFIRYTAALKLYQFF